MDAADCHLALLLATSDDAPNTGTAATSSALVSHMDRDASDDAWSDLSSAEWQQLLLAVDGSSPIVSDSDDASSKGAPRKARESQSYRIRKRLELVQLRKEVAELEAQVHQLRAARRASSNTVPSSKEQVVSLAWKRIATHQKALRREVQEENTRLKAALEYEQEVASKLARLLQKRCSSDGAPRSIKRQRRPEGLQLDLSLFCQLSTNLEPRLQGVDTMLQQAGFAALKADVERIRAYDVRGSTVDAEVVSAKVFPFHHSMTAEAVWRCCGASYSPVAGQSEFSALSCTDTQIEMAFSVPLSVRHCDAQLDAQVVMRRSKEQTRIVQWYEGVWVLRSANPAYDGVTLRDRGWHVIEDLVGDKELVAADASSIVQCFSRIRLDMPKLCQDEHEKTMVRDLLLDLYSQNQQSAFRTFESALLERMLRC